MNADERDEIAASVAAHAELGPRYETAVAEGLVERIGEEIDKRVDARLRGTAHQPLPKQVAYPSAAPGAPDPARRSNGVTGMILGLASMGLGLGATAVVASHNPAAGAEIVMILLIWAAIAVINIAHSQRR